MKCKFVKSVRANLFVLIACAAYFASAAANAALVTGTATLSLDNGAISLSNPGGWYVERHWGSADNELGVDGDTAGGTALPVNGNAELLFPVNSNPSTIAYPAAGASGRTLQATTMDANDIGNGQIGLSGALRMRDPGQSSYLAPYDFSLVKANANWFIRSFDSAFSYVNIFQLANVAESVDANGQLLLNGDLLWAGGGFTWASLLGADTAAVIGHFSLAPSAVPLPPALWLFASSLLGLSALKRRRPA